MPEIALPTKLTQDEILKYTKGVAGNNKHIEKFYLGGTTYTEVINITGKGVLNSVSGGGSSTSMYLEIIVDGVVVITELPFVTSSGSNISPNFPFENSLVIKMRSASTASVSGIFCYTLL